MTSVMNNIYLLASLTNADTAYKLANNNPLTQVIVTFFVFIYNKAWNVKNNIGTNHPTNDASNIVNTESITLPFINSFHPVTFPTTIFNHQVFFFLILARILLLNII